MRQSNTSLFDVILCLTIGFIAIAVVAIFAIQEKQKAADIKTKAEFVVVLTWQDKVDHDVDLWIRDPNGNVMFFRAKQVGVMHLDRDDLGNKDDTHVENGVVHIVPYNQEIATIRGLIEGEWVINTHFYRVSNDIGFDRSAHCNLTVTKLNPIAKIVLSESFVLTESWEEKTIARLVMTPAGDILSIVKDFPAKLVQSRVTRYGATTTP